jgi:biotin-dependent carboxylase-like uncharacterized protein
MSELVVIKPGALATIQDAGRAGLRRYGIPPSGAMDQFSYRIGNILVGNDPGAASIEVTLQGLILEARGAMSVVITGGDSGAHMNDQPAPMWTSLRLHKGDRINFKRRVTGCRAYVAVSGGIDAPELLGSRSTFAKGRMGAPLRENDVLKIGRGREVGDRALPVELRPTFPSRAPVRVILGPQHERFTRRGLQVFIQSTYRMSPNSDRQGIRTDGPAIEAVSGYDIISDPTPLGAVQVPGDGKPIILHRDGQVTGGYAKIATVISTDLDKFGQMAPGDPVRFDVVTREQALSIARAKVEEMAAIEALLKQ